MNENGVSNKLRERKEESVNVSIKGRAIIRD